MVKVSDGSKDRIFRVNLNIFSNKNPEKYTSIRSRTVF